MKKDFVIENEKLYTIREAADICGVSRATLLRMEEAGFDAPPGLWMRKTDTDITMW